MRRARAKLGSRTGTVLPAIALAALMTSSVLTAGRAALPELRTIGGMGTATLGSDATPFKVMRGVRVGSDGEIVAAGQDSGQGPGAEVVGVESTAPDGNGSAPAPFQIFLPDPAVLDPEQGPLRELVGGLLGPLFPGPALDGGQPLRDLLPRIPETTAGPHLLPPIIVAPPPTATAPKPVAPAPAPSSGQSSGESSQPPAPQPAGSAPERSPSPPQNAKAGSASGKATPAQAPAPEPAKPASGDDDDDDDDDEARRADASDRDDKDDRDERDDDERGKGKGRQFNGEDERGKADEGKGD